MRLNPSIARTQACRQCRNRKVKVRMVACVLLRLLSCNDAPNVVRPQMAKMQSLHGARSGLRLWVDDAG